MSGRPEIDGEKVRQLRDEKMFWNQRELAEAAGLSVHTVMRIEKGHSAKSYRSTIRALAKALGVTPQELLIQKRSS